MSEKKDNGEISLTIGKQKKMVKGKTSILIVKMFLSFLVVVFCLFAGIKFDVGWNSVFWMAVLGLVAIHITSDGSYLEKKERNK